MNCIAAWTDTAETSFPHYLNFSEDGEFVRVTLRETPVRIHSGHMINGCTASVLVPRAAFSQMLYAAGESLK